MVLYKRYMEIVHTKVYKSTLLAVDNFLLRWRDELLPCDTVLITPPSLPALTIGIDRWSLLVSPWPAWPKRSSDLAPLSIPDDDFVAWTLTEPALPPCPLEDPGPRGEPSGGSMLDAEWGLNESILVKLLLLPCNFKEYRYRYQRLSSKICITKILLIYQFS